MGDPKIAPGGGGWTPTAGGGGVGEVGFCAGLFVLCKSGCWHQRRRNTKIWPEKGFFHQKISPHICVVKNDQRDVGIMLSHICWG